MARYTIKPEFLTLWGEDCTADTVVDTAEVERLAAEWDKPVEELLEQLEEVETTCGEYFAAHEDENLGWCKPYADSTGKIMAVLNAGKIDCITIHGIPLTVTPESIRDLAEAVNGDYYCYEGWDDTHIALDAMQEKGCASCPCFAECEAMHEARG